MVKIKGGQPPLLSAYLLAFLTISHLYKILFSHLHHLLPILLPSLVPALYYSGLKPFNNTKMLSFNKVIWYNFSIKQ